MWEDQTNPLFYKRTSGGLAFCFSACDDHQTSADTTVSKILRLRFEKI